jgi:predicted glycogen debranching enzyme
MYTIQTAGKLRPALEQEWLLTNGLGAFADGTVAGCNTRRYHGLLCAATLPPVGRILALSRVGEILLLDSRPNDMLELSVNQFAERFHPRGDKYLQTFELDDIARWTFQVEGVEVIKEVQLAWMKNAVGIRYTIRPSAGTSLEFGLLPFVAMRDFHTLRRGDGGLNAQVQNDSLVVTADKLTLNISAQGTTFNLKPDWWFGHFYAIEAERGMDSFEDLFNPGWFTARIKEPTTITLWASLNASEKLDWEAEVGIRRKARAPIVTFESPILKNLARAADDFIVARKAPDGQDGCTIMAGYPWFSDWGRDTMISLPGLLLATGKFDQARQVLRVFAQYCSEGMIPNVFNDYTGKPEYNTVDASLWFVHAVFEYARLSKDQATFDQILKPACRQIIDGYRAGTRYGIKMDELDGLIHQGDATTQLTWMDAKCGDVAFTPRQGKPVEINALWHHALKLMGEEALAAKVAASFSKAFWISPFRGLADVVDGSRRDQAIRPNQIFAVSLPNSPLTRDQQLAVVEVVGRELLTPMGLRTLARDDPGYRGRYSGGPWQRDSAYHNGTVWPWLIGPFVEAHLRAHEKSKLAIDQARRWLMPLIEMMSHSGCIGQLCEIDDGDPPYRPVGTYAQAWSIAEVFRMAIELGM